MAIDPAVSWEITSRSILAVRMHMVANLRTVSACSRQRAYIMFAY